MLADNNTKENLVSGRAGELTHSANELTFDFIERIFGQRGPYRNVLKKFKINFNDLEDSYLVLRDSVVYTDLNKEQRIIWGNYPYNFKIEKGNAVLVFDSSKLNFKNIINYFAKIIHDSQVILNIDSYLEEARRNYKNISTATSDICNKQNLSLETFLTLYEKIIYVSYLFELVDLYNTKKPTEKYAVKYVHENDYLLNDETLYIENVLKLPNGFYLGDYKGLDKEIEKAEGLEFIPDEIAPFTAIVGYPKLICVEKELQCLKNNLRLKTNILLYFLNLTLLKKATKKGIQLISDKKLTDILN